MLIVKIYEMLTDSLIAHKKDMLKIVTAVNFFSTRAVIGKIVCFYDASLVVREYQMPSYTCADLPTFQKQNA